MAGRRRQLQFFLPPVDRCRLRALPDRPGVYKMFCAGGRLLYVGKARSLRQRVRSYFQRGERHSDRIREMVSRAARIDFDATGSLLEAAVRESDEIKRCSPRFNVALTGRRRKACFYARNYESARPTRDETHVIGPLTRPDLGFFLRLMKDPGYDAARRIDADFEMFARLLPGFGDRPDLVRRACGEFFDKYASYFRPLPWGLALDRIGKILWTQTGDDASPATLPPVQALETLVRRAAWELRKVRWYALLSESVVAWTEVTGRKYKRVVAVIEKGQLAKCADLVGGENLPVPPGYRKRFSERQRQLDLAALDRMKVVTSEIKRIMRNDRWIVIRASPMITMDQARITKMLKWL